MLNLWSIGHVPLFFLGNESPSPRPGLRGPNCAVAMRPHSWPPPPATSKQGCRPLLHKPLWPVDMMPSKAGAGLPPDVVGPAGSGSTCPPHCVSNQFSGAPSRTGTCLSGAATLPPCRPSSIQSQRLRAAPVPSIAAPLLRCSFGIFSFLALLGGRLAFHRLAVVFAGHVHSLILPSRAVRVKLLGRRAEYFALSTPIQGPIPHFRLSFGKMRVVDELLPLSNVAATCADGDTALTRAFRALRSRRLSCENLLALRPSLATPATAIIADSWRGHLGPYRIRPQRCRDAFGHRPARQLRRSRLRRPLAPLSATIAALAPWSDRQAVDHHGCDALMLAIEKADSTGPASCAEITAILAPRVDVFSCDSLGESSLEKALDRGLANVAEIIQARMAILAERDALGLAASEPASPPSRKLTRI